MQVHACCVREYAGRRTKNLVLGPSWRTIPIGITLGRFVVDASWRLGARQK